MAAKSENSQEKPQSRWSQFKNWMSDLVVPFNPTMKNQNTAQAKPATVAPAESVGKNEKKLQQFYEKHEVRAVRPEDQQILDEKKGNRSAEFMVKATTLTGDFHSKFWDKVANSDSIRKSIDASAVKYLEELRIDLKTNKEGALPSGQDIREKLQNYFIANMDDKELSKIQKDYKKATSIQNDGLKLLAKSIFGAKAGKAVDAFQNNARLPRLGDINPKDIDKRDIAMQLAEKLWAARRAPENEEKAAKNADATLATLPQQPNPATASPVAKVPLPAGASPSSVPTQWTAAKPTDLKKTSEHDGVFDHVRPLTPHRQSIGASSSGTTLRGSVKAAAPDLPPPGPVAHKPGK